MKNLLGLSASALIIGLVVLAMAEDNAKKVADDWHLVMLTANVTPPKQ